MKIRTRFWVALIATIAAIFVSVHIAEIVYRNAHYRRVLKTYSDVLKPGMTRSEVETYLTMSRHVSFLRVPSIGPRHRPYDDVAQIGHEKGWICQEQLVHVAFEFATEKEWAAGSDRLEGISLLRTSCLDLP